MKKIAVITYHRSYNYGAVLQAYATVKFFKLRKKFKFCRNKISTEILVFLSI